MKQPIFFTLNTIKKVFFISFRCGICLMKNMKPMAAKEACKANPNPKKCIKEKMTDALKTCN